jgi:hypothetical protein
MAMTSDDDEIERQLSYHPRCGDDSPPLMSLVPEPPPSHWGKLTGQSRTLSPQYMKFLGRKEAGNGRAAD